jgi:hypothetical protein
MAKQDKDEILQDAVPLEETTPQVMDIRRYLGKRDYPNNLNGLFLSMFGGKLKTESEWDSITKEIISRKA